MKVDTLYNKGGGIVNEDALLVADPIFGVFDGATNLESQKNLEGKTGASIASSIAREVFLNGNKPLIELALDANDKISAAMAGHGIDASKKIARWATTAAAVKINKDSFDWVQIGDSLILTIFKNGSFQLLIDGYDHDLESMLMWKDLADKKTENIRASLMEQFIKARSKMNIDYGALNGEKSAEKFLKHGFGSLDEVAHLILFTDGLFLPKEDPRQPDDFETFVKLYLEGGLKLIGDYVREKETSDPKCWKYPRFKQYDDIAAVAISF